MFAEYVGLTEKMLTYFATQNCTTMHTQSNKVSSLP